MKVKIFAIFIFILCEMEAFYASFYCRKTIPWACHC